MSGNGGYYNLHKLTATSGTVDPATQAKLVAGDDKSHGYMILTVDAKNITGTAFIAGATSAPLVRKRQKRTKQTAGAAQTIDTFSYPAAAQFLPKGTAISL